MGKKRDDPPPPPLPDPPEGKPLDFDDFVGVLRAKRPYAHAIHKMVMWGRRYDCKEAMRQLNEHVRISPVQEDLEVTGPIDSENNTSRCSNNTKFFMLDFSKYV
jgi:hypothetical protein